MKKIMFICLLLMLCAGVSIAAEKTNDDTKQDERLIVVTGQDYVEALPDTAYFSFSVTVEKSTPEEASAVGEQLKKNIIAVVKDVGIEKKDILEDATTVQERYDYEGKRTYHIFHYSTRLRLTNFTTIAELRKALVNEKTFAPVKEAWFSKRGLSVDQQVSYEIVINKNSVEQAAIKKAFESALGKIKTIADTMQLKWTIHSVVESGADYRPVYRVARGGDMKVMAMAENAAAPEPQEDTTPTLQRITAQVTVEAEIL